MVNLIKSLCKVICEKFNKITSLNLPYLLFIHLRTSSIKMGLKRYVALGELSSNLNILLDSLSTLWFTWLLRCSSVTLSAKFTLVSLRVIPVYTAGHPKSTSLRTKVLTLNSLKNVGHFFSWIINYNYIALQYKHE